MDPPGLDAGTDAFDTKGDEQILAITFRDVNQAHRLDSPAAANGR